MRSTASPSRSGRRAAGRRGVGVAEVVVVVAILGFVVVLIALALPRQRERAREAACQRNLMQVGVALGLYQQLAGKLPTVPELGPIDAPARPGPLAALLDTLAVPDFASLEPGRMPESAGAAAGPRTEGRFLLGLVCPSDTSPALADGRFPAPVSYRATTGDDPAGASGPFAPGVVVGLDEIEAADGLSYTAAFSERLLGTGTPEPSPANYGAVEGPVPPGGCPPGGDWRGDAGSSWAEAAWRSSLYHHALPPQAGRSCVALDGRTAGVGASSGHVDRKVYVLLLDGSVRPYAATVDPRVWARLATVHDLPPAP